MYAFVDIVEEGRGKRGPSGIYMPESPQTMFLAWDVPFLRERDAFQPTCLRLGQRV